MNSMEIWIGLAHVKPRPGNDLLNGAVGAFVPVIALADSDTELASAAVTLLKAYEFDVLEVEDIELFAKRQQRYDIDNEIVELAAGLSQENPITLSTFDTYHSEG